jgi:hypothetical protein
MLFDEYNDVLTDALKPVGLQHGFIMTSEGTFWRHFIYKDAGVRTFLWGMIKRPIRKVIAEVVAEPAAIVPFMQGARKATLMQVTVQDGQYEAVIREVVNALNAVVHQGGRSAYMPIHELNVIGSV